MASSSERRTIIQAEPSIDRISDLPENLHSKILSLLPTKEAVKTSLLSTKWRFIWTSITKLDFNNSFSEYRKVTDTQLINSKKIMFTQFVNRILLLHNSHIQNFHLKLDSYFTDIFYLNSWICAAMSRSVKDMNLILKLEKPIELPLTHFYCKSLVVLKLLGNIHFKLRESTSVCFPSLQILHMNQTTLGISSKSSVSFPKLEILKLLFVICVDEDSAHQLLSNCPVLDNLVIHKGDWENISYLIISIPSLTRLLLRFENSVKVQIDTPQLQYLDLDCVDCEYLNAENYFSSLFQAEVKFYFNIERMGYYAKIYSTSMFKFIEGLSGVKFLSLLGCTLKAIRSVPRSVLPTFQNVVRLELENVECLDWQVVLKTILQNTDNLEHIVMKGSIHYQAYHESWWIEPSDVPKCLLYRVRYISCFNMNDCQDELELLRFFLGTAKVLKLLKIDAVLNSEKKSNLAQKISMFPRGSPTCQVEFD